MKGLRGHSGLQGMPGPNVSGNNKLQTVIIRFNVFFL